MKTIRILVVACAAALLTSACTQPRPRTAVVVPAVEAEITPAEAVVLDTAPPTRSEVVTADPGVRYSWNEGAWVFVNNNWIRVPGYWKQEESGAVWTAGRWERTDKGWLWIPGAWNSAVGGTVDEEGEILEEQVEELVEEAEGGIAVEVEPGLPVNIVEPVPVDEE